VSELTTIERRVYHYLIDFPRTPIAERQGRSGAASLKSTKTVVDILQSLAMKVTSRVAGRSRGCG
jgi:hypothetical protein